MSPEQLRAGVLSPKNDIWSFAGVLLQFSTGIRIYNNIRQDHLLMREIIEGKTPLESMLENYPMDCNLVKQN